MTEVIDLLSSSPPKPSKEPENNIPDKSLSSKNLFSFDSDDFNTTGDLDLDFLVDRPAKRRRLSPSPALPETVNALPATKNEIFDLSSEGSGLPDIAVLTQKSATLKDQDSVVHLDHDNVFSFSSSAPEPSTNNQKKDLLVLELSSDNEIDPDDPIQSSPDLYQASKPILSERTANLLAGLKANNTKSNQKYRGRVGRSMSVDREVNRVGKFKQTAKTTVTTRDEIVDSSQPEKAKKSKPKAKDNDKDESIGSRSKAASKAERDAAKEAEKERKRKEKEQKALDKQKAADIAEVNKSKTNKKNSTSEMIVDMPASLQGLSVANQVEEYMKQLEVPVSYSRDEEVGDTAITSGNIIRWRRKVVADWDEDIEIWKPLPQPRVTHEKHVLILLKAEEFVDIAVIGHSSTVKSAADVPETIMKTNLDAHVQTVRSQYPNNTIIYQIEGLSAWNRKSATLKNRAYTAAVRAQILDNEPSTSTAPPSSQPQTQTQPRPRAQKRKKASPPVDLSSITEDQTETLLLHLQLHHQPLLIHHTTSPATTAAQITSFTQHLSTRPYRLAEQSANLASASFCMTTGQIRTGATPHETYINMLQEINRVTPSMAYGISAAGYSTVGKLVGGFREEGNLMLEDVRKSVNRDGGWSDRRLGPMVSRRLYKVFMGRDSGARDGIA